MMTSLLSRFFSFRISTSALLVFLSVQPFYQAHAAESIQSVVDKAALTVEDIFSTAGSRKNSLETDLAKARAVMICPSLFKMSFGIGGSHGNCVLLARDARGSWSDPAFYTLSSGSLGFQFGVQSAEIIFFIMTDRGLQALLDSQFQFDSNASATFANMSTAAAAGTAGAKNTDILIAQKSAGVFAGASLGGSKLTVNSDYNRGYYKQFVGPEDIVVSMRVNNPDADPLRRVLMRYSNKTPQRKVIATETINEDFTPNASSGDIRSENVSQEKLTPLSK